MEKSVLIATLNSLEKQLTVSTAKFSSSEVSHDGDVTANKMFGTLKVKKKKKDFKIEHLHKKLDRKYYKNLNAC